MILSALMFVYVAFFAISYFAGRKSPEMAEKTAIIGSVVALLVSVLALTQFDFSSKSMQLMEEKAWIPSLGVTYKLGIDGLSMPMVLLSTFLTVFACLISKKLVDDKKDVYYPILMLLGLSMIGVFVSLDFFLFYIFWEIVLIFMFFLVALWGGPNKKYASIKFLIYTHVGSLIMLLAIIAMYFASGLHTFDMIALSSVGYPLGFQYIAFLAFFFAFIVKMPIFPFHTWLPDAHVEAPTAGSVLLAGVLLKMGAYGLLRVPYTMFPEMARSLGPYIVILATVSAVYSAFVAMTQKDLKKMIAYSSVTHMGLVLLGIASLNQIALSGAIYEMVAHGLISALMFTLAGMIHHSYGTRDVDKLSGLAIGTPRLGWLLVIGSLAAFGLPTFAGFVAEFMILTGSYLALGSLVLPALLAILVTAAYFLWMMQRVVFSESHKHGHDIGFSELLPIGMILFFIVLLGVYPPVLLNISNALSINVFG